MERPLVALLPADTAVALQVHRLADLLAAYDASPLAALIATDVEIGALLLSEEELRDWRDAHAEAQLQTHLDLGRDFLLAWAGRELTLALIPAPDEPQRLLARFLAQEGIACLDLLPAMLAAPAASEMYYPMDSHWNRLGHDFAARQLAAFLIDEGLLSAARDAGR